MIDINEKVEGHRPTLLYLERVRYYIIMNGSAKNGSEIARAREDSNIAPYNDALFFLTGKQARYELVKKEGGYIPNPNNPGVVYLYDKEMYLILENDLGIPRVEIEAALKEIKPWLSVYQLINVACALNTKATIKFHGTKFGLFILHGLIKGRVQQKGFFKVQSEIEEILKELNPKPIEKLASVDFRKNGRD